MATLAYPPLYPVGTKEFDDDGRRLGPLCAAGLPAGRTCGHRRLRRGDLERADLRHAVPRHQQLLRQGEAEDPRGPDFLNRGRHCWELARRTIEAVKREYPKARCIWGFSNTTFFHCPIAKLPPGTDGQSYHPYGTGTRSLPRQEQYPDKPRVQPGRLHPHDRHPHARGLGPHLCADLRRDEAHCARGVPDYALRSPRRGRTIPLRSTRGPHDSCAERRAETGSDRSSRALGRSPAAVDGRGVARSSDRTATHPVHQEGRIHLMRSIRPSSPKRSIPMSFS